MASGPITSWKIDREKMETVTDFIFLGSKITVYSDYSHEIKRHLILRKKAGLKLSIQETKIMASSPITSWQIDGEKMETVTDLIFLSSTLLQMVTAAMKFKDVCSLEEKL